MNETERVREVMHASQAAYPTPSLIGMFVGGLILIYLLSKLVEWAAIKRLFNDPLAGCVLSVVIAYVLAVIIYGYGSADGGYWNSYGIIGYLPGAVTVAVVRTWLRKRRIDKIENEDSSY